MADLNQAVVEALVRLAQADFTVRLPRQEDRSPEDALAFLINGLAEELQQLWETSQRHQEDQQRTVDMVSDGLLAMASGQFRWTAERTGDGSPRDVLAYLINHTMHELEQLVASREQHATEVAMLRSAQITERLAGMGTLAAGAAHELSSPLSAALLFLQEARDSLRSHPPGAQDALPWIENALEGVERASILLDDLRVFAREKPRAVGPVRLDHVVGSAVRLLFHEAKTRCELVTRVAPVTVIANEARLGQVFVNLIKNAIQAIDPGDRRNQGIRVTSAIRGDRVVVTVRDTGCGMSETVLSRAFEAFFTTKAPHEGTGLGLPISQATVLELGGDLTITSQPGGGTTVTVVLPIATCLETSLPAPEAPRQDPPGSAVVLVIDDDPILLGALCQVLRREYRVEAAASGERALELLTQIPNVDLILCDVMMPQMTGIEFYHRVRQDSEDLARRILFFSGGGVTEQARQFLEEVGEYLRKPVSRQQLLHTVRQRIRSHREVGDG